MSLKTPFWQVVTYMPTNIREPTYYVVKSAILNGKMITHLDPIIKIRKLGPKKRKWNYFQLKSNTIIYIITPPTSFSQSCHSIDVTWRHTLSPRCTQRQKSVTGIHWNAYYRLNKGWWRDKFVIRSISDVLRPHPPQILLTYFGPEVRQKQTL